MRIASRSLLTIVLVPIAACATMVTGSAIPVPPPMERLTDSTELHQDLSLHRIVSVDSYQELPPGVTSTIDDAGFVITIEEMPLLEVNEVESITAGWSWDHTTRLIELRLNGSDRSRLTAWTEANQSDEFAAVIDSLMMAPMAELRGDSIQLSILDTSGESNEALNALVG